MKVICIDDGGRPNEVPASHWVKKDTEYTVTKVMKLHVQGIYGFELEEIDLKPFSPYEYFSADRFRPVTEAPVEEEEMEMQA